MPSLLHGETRVADGDRPPLISRSRPRFGVSIHVRGVPLLFPMFLDVSVLEDFLGVEARCPCLVLVGGAWVRPRGRLGREGREARARGGGAQGGGPGPRSSAHERDAPFGGGGGAVFFKFGAVLAGCAFSFCCGEWVTGCLGFERCLVGLVVGVQSLIHKLNTFRGSVWTGQGGGGVFGKVSLSNLRVNALCMNT